MEIGVPLIRQRKWYVLLFVWGGIVLAAIFIFLVGRDPTVTEWIVMSLLAALYLDKVTVPWIDREYLLCPPGDESPSKDGGDWDG